MQICISRFDYGRNFMLLFKNLQMFLVFQGSIRILRLSSVLVFLKVRKAVKLKLFNGMAALSSKTI
jgi:hypothetical protein